MKKLPFFLLSFLLVGFLGCKKSDSSDPKFADTPDYLIFGHFYGYCIGEKCIEIFKLEKTQLSEDKNDKYPRSDKFYEGDFSAISDEKFQEAKDLLNSLPQELLNEKDTRIGTPDAGDWGGYYVEYKKGNTRKFWLIDKMKSNIPTYLYEFTDKMDEKIKKISS